MEKLTEEQIWQILDQVKDPEIPVVSVVEMGMVRSVSAEGSRVQVVFTPTFAGCPAVQVLRSQMKARLEEAGADSVHIQVAFSPPWTSEQITPAGREKLKGFGLSPPPRGGDLESRLLQPAVCPYCDSTDTSLRNSFGSSLCRAIYTCNQCQQPFEQFKPL